MPTLRSQLRVVPGPVDLDAIDTTATPGAPGDKAATTATHAELSDTLADLQEQLYAEAQAEDSSRRVLLILQGMDASGKDGVIKRGLGGLNPGWADITGFSAPTPEEREHHYLWRIRNALPGPGRIGIFSRSHYEDIVAVGVRGLAPEDVWRPRFEEINEFERELAGDGCTIVKVFMHISREYQLERQLRRLDRVDKRWKFDEGDIDDRERWTDFHALWGEVLERCNADVAPWYVVPADTKWYRNWAVAQLLKETLEDLGLHWPERPELDLAALRARLERA
jgi:PPK2 family polyphosphate:nucleotide phosphotransferase